MNVLWMERILRLGLGGIFLYTGYARLDHPHMIAQHLASLGLFPWEIINFFAQWMLGFEIVTGFFVITGVWIRTSSLLLCFFTLMCTSLVSYALIQDLSLHCGCFVTTATGAARTWSSLWQEGIMLSGSVALVTAAFRKGMPGRTHSLRVHTSCQHAGKES